MSDPIQSTRGDGVAEVGAHKFRRYRRWFNHGRCAWCLLHERYHPTRGWVKARRIGDNTPALDPEQP